MRGEDVANPTKPGQKGHDRHGVEPREASPDLRHSPPGQAAAGKPAGVVPPMKRQVPFEREMDVSRPAEEREHAEREAHDETEKIKISPGHRTPRARAGVRDADPTTQFCSDAGGGCPLPSWPPLRRCPELKTSPSRSARPGVRRISASSSTALRESCTSAMASSARCSSGSAVNCSAPAKSHESIFASIARNSDCRPGVYPSGSSTRNPG